MTTPIGLSLLFLMAVAPVLPWRKASLELLRHRLYWPAWAGTLSVVIAVVLGARGLTPLLAFGLAGFAAGSAVRQLALATRRQGLRGLLGRANGGMVVHIGVILIAVGLAASQSFTRTVELQLHPGDTARFGGHTFELLPLVEEDEAAKIVVKAPIRIDGHDVYAPSQNLFRASGQVIGTPSVRTGLRNDIYLTLEKRPEGDGATSIKIIILPMVAWIWVGGGVMALGTLLAAFPGRRRRPVEPVSSPVGLPEADAKADDRALAGVSRVAVVPEPQHP
jgi:cytochrome c-type biogenesis protein CcmF